MAKPSNTIITAPDCRAAVDELGALRAQIADLQEQEKAAREIIVEAADGEPAEVAGEGYRATVAFQTRTTVDYKSILEAIVNAGEVGAKRMENLLVKHSSEGEPYAVVRVTARKVSR